MNFKLAASALALGLVALVGCAADSSEQSSSSDSDIVARPVDVKGAWRMKPNSAGSSFIGAVFNADGTFFADVDTGIRCVTTPCPTTARLEGTYSVFGRSLLLVPSQGAAKDPSDANLSYYGRYSVGRTGEALTISALGTESIGSELALESSYCAAPVDCAGQGIIHPMCVGSWTCSAQSTCGYACGMTPVDDGVWPTDRTQLVAETRGGGFTPPPAAGSTCAIGAAKYTLDIATKKLDWEVCSFTDWSTPMHPVTGSVTLTAAQLKKVDAAMKTVKITDQNICGADKPMLNIAVTSAAKGTVEYTDSFYACMGGERLFVDNIDSVFSAFRDLAGK